MSDTEFNDYSQDATGIAELSKRGYQLLKENKITEAKDCFTKILLLDSNNNYALVGMGDAARKFGNSSEAIAYYDRCLEQHPGNNYALFGLADCYKTLNQYRKAIEIWEQYLLHDDANITILTRVADAYRKVKNFKQSKAVYQKVLQLEENNHYAIIGLGHLHYDFKKYEDALFYWEKMLTLADSEVDIRVLTSIGNCHRKLKSFAAGIPYFESALRMDSENFYALFGLADCYRGMKKQDNSLEYWNRILNHDSRNRVILTRAGDAYRIMKMYDKAQEYYERALNIEYDMYAVLGLALIAKAHKKYTEAIESMKQLLQLDPGNSRIMYELTDCYIQSGDKRKAVEISEEFQRPGTRNFNIADIHP
ncbi:MAG: tetratricopeptide repeat protein [Treponema sp.]|nr:tetratricopeptide repeat protein [Treponema sp.]